MVKGKTALIIVDVQHDFLPPDGALAVPHGDEILPVIGDLLDSSKWDWSLVIASQDYHPNGHISFASSHPPSEPFSKKAVKDVRDHKYEQTLWPDHCVQGTKGAEIEQSIQGRLKDWEGRVKMVRKGTHVNLETYSAFEGYVTDAIDPADPPTGHAIGSKDGIPGTTELTDYLRSEGVEKVVIVGLAADFCVLQTALSALDSSFETLLIAPAVRGISAEDTSRALEQIEGAGGKVVGRDGKDWEEVVYEWI